jgi:hypothetical protein
MRSMVSLIVRLENGQQVSPKGDDGQPNAYLPPQGGAVELNDLPMVKASLLTKERGRRFSARRLRSRPPRSRRLCLDQDSSKVPKFPEGG